MYACVCFSITEEEIHDEISGGARTEEELGERCGAGTSCGTCVERLGCLIEEARRRPCVEHALKACPSVCDAGARVGEAITGDALAV
jgi:bacterioferritin-associated ferredoxin